MHDHAELIAFLRMSLSSPITEAVAIIAAVLVQEDVTAVAVGIMASQGRVAPPLAIVSLILGELVNDFGLYSIGRLAITHPRLHRWVAHEKRLPLRSRLNAALIPTVVAVQFLPGFRLPVYVACGFFSLSLRRFAMGIIPAVAAWSPIVFSCAYFYGEYAAKMFGFWQWPIAIMLLVAAGYASRAYWKNVIDR